MAIIDDFWQGNRLPLACPLASLGADRSVSPEGERRVQPINDCVKTDKRSENLDSIVGFTHRESNGGIIITCETAAPLLIECDDCSGAGQITHDHPNDPWARAWTCSMCDGTGEVIAGCECCREDAVEIFGGLYLCAVHAAEARADAESVP